MGQNDVVVWQNNSLPVSRRVAHQFALQVQGIRLAAELARTAVDEISNVYGYAEFRVITTISATEAIKKAVASSRDISPMEEAALQSLRQGYLHRVAQITEQTGEHICLLTDGASAEMHSLTLLDRVLGRRDGR